MVCKLTFSCMKTILLTFALLMLPILKVKAQEATECKWEFPKTIMISESSEPDYRVKITCSCVLKSVKITVLNRWGQELYSTNQLEHVWQGKDTPDGVYMLIVTGKYADGKEFNQSASVNYFH